MYCIMDVTFIIRVIRQQLELKERGSRVCCCCCLVLFVFFIWGNEKEYTVIQKRSKKILGENCRSTWKKNSCAWKKSHTLSRAIRKNIIRHTGDRDVYLGQLGRISYCMEKLMCFSKGNRKQYYTARRSSRSQEKMYSTPWNLEWWLLRTARNEQTNKNNNKNMRL